MHDLVKVKSDQTFEQRLRAKLGAAGARTSGTAADTDCLLLDCSGSMRESCDNYVSKIDELWKLVGQFPGVRRFAFSHNCQEIPQGKVQAAGGGTNMAAAFSFVKAQGIKHAVLITDGMPDDAAAAIKHADGLKVDIFYVGPDPAPPFLKQLSTATGGQYGQATFGSGSKSLASAVRGLLEAPAVAKQPILL